MSKFFDSWWGWLLCFGGITTAAFIGEWTTFYKILFGLILLSGLLRLLRSHHAKKLKELKAMTTEDREQWLSQLDPKTRDLWQKQIDEFEG